MAEHPQRKEVASLLQAGIAAAKAGRREEARQLLQRAVEEDEGNLNAWLWLSGVVDDDANRRVCLQHALDLDPQNEAARRGLERLRRQQVEDLLQAGIAAAKRGQPDHARGLLLRVVDQDERNVPAWLWLSGLVGSLEERQLCLENVLALDPANQAARRGLEQVREQQEAQAAARAETAPVLTPAQEIPFSGPVIPEEPWDLSLADDFDNPLLCPVCASETAHEDKRCPSCGTRLWLKRRKREQPSFWLWIAVTLQLLNTLVYGVAVFVALVVVRLAAQIDTLDKVLAIYLGLPVAVTPEQAELAFTALPPWVFFLLVACFLWTFFVLASLIMRWTWVWYLLLVNAVLQLAEGILAATRAGPLVVLCSAIPAIAMVLIVFQMQDDFFYNYVRILLQPDREARSGTDYLARGRRYARQGRWALAVVHLQRAAGAMSNRIEPQLMLALSYLQLKRYDRAEEALAEARRMDPTDPRIEELAADLDRATGAA